MPRISMSDRIRALVMGDVNIPESSKREIVNALSKARRKTPQEKAVGEWGDLAYAVQRARTGVSTNKARWAPDLAPLMQEYVDLLSRVIKLIRTQSVAYATINECAAATKEKNEKRVNMRELPLGERNKYWQTWVPPHVTQDFCLRVEQVYAERIKGNAHADKKATNLRGKRFRPFQPAYERLTFERQLTRAQKAITNLRTAAADDPRGNIQGTTGYRALILAACRMAERELQRIEKNADMGTLPLYEATAYIPVNWQALLTPEMRERLRDAQANPNLVSEDGLESFLCQRLTTVDQGNEFAPPIPEESEDTQDTD